MEKMLRKNKQKSKILKKDQMKKRKEKKLVWYILNKKVFSLYSYTFSSAIKLDKIKINLLWCILTLELCECNLEMAHFTRALGSLCVCLLLPCEVSHVCIWVTACCAFALLDVEASVSAAAADCV